MADPAREPTDAAAPINPALLTALTTEHFTVQGAGAATISESSSRSALYIKGHAATTIEILFTFASMIAVISSVILGAVLALAVASVFGAAPGVAIGAGGVSARVDPAAPASRSAGLQHGSLSSRAKRAQAAAAPLSPALALAP